MSNLLSDAATYLDGTLRSVASETVTYRRGQQTVSLVARPGQTVFRIDDGAGGSMRIVAHDWIVTASDLVLGDAAVLPERGDRITHGDRTYEVLAPGGEPPWRWHDRSHVAYRVHSKLVSANG